MLRSLLGLRKSYSADIEDNSQKSHRQVLWRASAPPTTGPIPPPNAQTLLEDQFGRRFMSSERYLQLEEAVILATFLQRYQI